jgi:hypothetical protein
MKNLLKWLNLLLSISLLIIACGGGGGGGPDPCDGPVPCLTNDFGTTVYEFTDGSGDPVVLFSDGEYVVIAGIYYDPDNQPYIIGIGGPVTSCREADLINAAIDWNQNGLLEEGEWLEPMEGGLDVCDETLSVYDLFLLGDAWHYREWTYVDRHQL